MKGLTVILAIYIYIYQINGSENDTMYHQTKNISIQSVKVWLKSVYLFRKQHTCPFNFVESKNLKQLSILLILGGQVELNPGPNIKYPCQVCNKPVRWNQKGIACDNCDLWYYQACISMNTDSYLRHANSSLAWLCKACHTPNHTSVLYESIKSDDNQFSSLYESNCNNENSHYTSFNDSLSTINSPLASSSPRKNRNIINNKLNKESIQILNINFQGIRNKKVALQNLLETTEANVHVLIGTETWLNDSIYSSEIIPTGQFDVNRNDRDKGKGGGVLIAVRRSLICSEIFKRNNTELIYISKSTS